jgi:hypothetical protein
MDAPGLGEPKEPKGKYKSSGYGNLNEEKKIPIPSTGQARPTTPEEDAEFEQEREREENEEDVLRGGRLELDEEGKLREAIRSMINEELKEGYDDGEMGTYQSTDTNHEKNPQDMGIYLSAIKGMTKVEAIEHLGEEGLSSSMVMRVLNKADRMGMFDVQDMFDVNPRVRGDVFEDKDDDGFDEVWEKFKKDLRKRMGQPESPKNESLNESKIKKLIRESVEKELAQINKEAEYEVLDSKLEKITDLIDRRKTRLSKLDEDEDIKALTDKKKVKQFEKEIKTLEKAKAKIEKVLAKKAKAAPKKKEVIDEDEPLDEAELNEIDPKGMEAANDASADMAKNFKDIESSVSKIELEEEDEEAPADYLAAKKDAEDRYDAGEELDSILSDYPKFRETLERDILGKFDGMDY